MPPTSPKPRRIGRTIALISIAAAVGLGGLIWWGVESLRKLECDATAMAVVPSPDRAWEAVTDHVVCSTGGFATTTVDDVVRVRRPGDALKRGTELLPGDVFTIDEGGDSSQRPILLWLSPQRLQITVPNKSFVETLHDKFQDVDIVVKFDPDDPAEREKFLKSFGAKTN